jgi:addiction module RelE/StbE family toxin
VEIYYSKNFLKNYRRLPQKVKTKFENLETTFRQNPFNPKLKTHPLSGNLKGFYSFSIDYHYRIVFNFETENEIWFHNVGTHQIYK